MDFVVPDPSYGVKECEEFFKVYDEFWKNASQQTRDIARRYADAIIARRRGYPPPQEPVHPAAFEAKTELLLRAIDENYPLKEPEWDIYAHGVSLEAKEAGKLPFPGMCLCSAFCDGTCVPATEPSIEPVWLEGPLVTPSSDSNSQDGTSDPTVSPSKTGQTKRRTRRRRRS